MRTHSTFVTVTLLSNEIYFANTTITFTCIVISGHGVQWLINNSIYTEESTFDPDISVGSLKIYNSSSIGNGTAVLCQATNNGTVIESSQKRKVILQGIH